MPARILLGVTGSIAAYKACLLVRMFAVRTDAEIHVAMTPAAREFVSPLTFSTLSRNPVPDGMFAQPRDWRPGHISLAQADVAVVAPCTANTMAKMAHGIADNLLTSVLLAVRAPVVVAPAMNDGMWANPATQANVATLRARGVRIVSLENGELACGTSGAGRLADVEDIFAAAMEALGEGKHRA